MIIIVIMIINCSGALCWLLPARFFSFLILHSLDGASARRKATTYTEQHRHRINTQTFMPLVGFEPTAPLYGRPRTVHALDRVATATGD
jgi:hypothetical protein